jgi:hypothetical protein
MAVNGGGLEMLSPDSRWGPVEIRQDSLVISVGNPMQQ